MRRMGIMLGMLAFASAAVAAETVKGELRLDSQGVARVTECKTGRTITLGVMNPNEYQSLIDRYWRASFNGKTPVLIEVRGAITRKGPPGTELVLESPNVVMLNNGRCEPPPDNALKKTPQQ